MPSTWSQEKYIQSLKFAAKAHNGQTVPGSDLPYIVHVTMVAMEVIAALAHETAWTATWPSSAPCSTT